MQSRHGIPGGNIWISPSEAAKVATLRANVERINADTGFNIQLVLDEPKAFLIIIPAFGLVV